MSISKWVRKASKQLRGRLLPAKDRVSGPVIRTERLVLSSPTKDDAERIAELANDPEISRFTLRVPSPYSKQDAFEFISFAEDRNEDGRAIELVMRLNGRVVGAIGAVSFDDKWHGASMGYWLGSEYRGHGYCTEALVALNEFIFKEKGVHKISAAHMVSNEKSGKVMERAGMKKEAVLRGHYCLEGQPEDKIIYSIFKEEVTGR